MVKHYVKPGMTGLAQIKGLRGDTSIEDRILADISYIENWSMMLDIYILFKTPFKAFNKHEKYVKEDKEKAEDKPTETVEKNDSEAEIKAEPVEKDVITDLEESIGIALNVDREREAMPEEEKSDD